MLEIKALWGGYGAQPVLRGVELTACSGQVTAILGPNGCGKSTLLKALCGIVTPERGSITLNGRTLSDLSRNELARTVAYLAQNRRVPDITAGRLVLHGRFPYLGYPRRYRAEDYAIAGEAMKKLGIEELSDIPLGNLSGGQRQKVYIAMALAQDTPVILLDEPTTYLDIRHQLRLMQHARRLADAGKTVLMVIHDISHAMRVADRIILMNKGIVAAQGTPEQVYISGALEQVFGVKVSRVQQPDGWHYCCEAAQEEDICAHM